ncbi:MAG TPA: hypothetical protein VK081_08190 [Planctomycetota bacterium]|nr:hypothetical protein [Planctomycetota bacterium]
MSGKSPAMGRPVLIAGIVTLAVTLVRLWGELRGLDARWFSTAPGGAGSVVGITWLMFVFGFWFGARLARGGAAPRSRARALVLHLIAIAILVATVAGVRAVSGADSSTLEGLKDLLLFSIPGAVVAALVACFAWPRLWLANFSYALLARIPVVVVTYVACHRQWGTHYEKLGPHDLAVADPMEKAFWLSVPQLALWPVLNVLAGGLCGTVAALVFRRRST